MKNSIPQAQDIRQRLNQLPARVNRPLAGLLDAGHLDALVLTTVLDAGELSNDVHRLMAFTISYLYLRQQGIPVADVIHMAKIHGRRINLWWSASRWKSEHDRLSRLATLKALSAENIAYDTQCFRDLLPASFPGYLIRGSRRLGMEGLRQRHCVASWDLRLRAGSCAIAVVFIDKRRWTVELFKSSSNEGSLYLGQVKTRFNGNPNKETRERILAALHIDEKSEMTPSMQCPDGGRLYRENITRLIPVLRQLNVRKITAFFSGSGDSGQIDDVNFEPASAKSALVQYRQLVWSYDGNRPIRNIVEMESSLEEAITEILYDYLGETGVDWYNGDGGQGEFLLNLDSEEMMLRVEQNYTETATEFEVEYSLDEFIAMVDE